MRITSTMQSYPVFPDWVFVGKLELSDQHIKSLISDVGLVERNNTNYGFSTKPNSVTTQMHNLVKLVGSMFYDNLVSHFQLNENQRNIESVNTTSYSINPGHHVNTILNRHRWYQSAVFLKTPVGGSSLQLDMLDIKLYSTPNGVQEYQHIIQAEECKVVFWPAQIPWSFTPNNGDSSSVILTSSYIINPPKKK